MKVEGDGHYLKAVNDGAGTVIDFFYSIIQIFFNYIDSIDTIYRTRAIINRSQIVTIPLNFH